MEKYGWIITKDVLDGVDVNVIGPGSVSDLMVSELKSGKGRSFRMYDDDGELYYEGKLLPATCEDERLFGPLDDFGMPNAGCTDIKYFNKKTGKLESV